MILIDVMKLTQRQQLFLVMGVALYLLGILTVYTGMPEIKSRFSPYSDIFLGLCGLVIGYAVNLSLDFME